MTDLSIPDFLRWRPPLPPRDVEVLAEEHHCERGCKHLTESYRRGYEEGARAERKRVEGEAALAGLLRLVAAAIFAAAGAWVGAKMAGR